MKTIHFTDQNVSSYNIWQWDFSTDQSKLSSRNHVYILSCKHASGPIRACVLSYLFYKLIILYTLRTIYLTIIPRARMGYESIADEDEGRMGYWLRGHEGERNNCFSKIQLVGQKNIETKHLSLAKARLKSFFAAKTLQIWRALFATSAL